MQVGMDRVLPIGWSLFTARERSLLVALAVQTKQRFELEMGPVVKSDFACFFECDDSELDMLVRQNWIRINDDTITFHHHMLLEFVFARFLEGER